MPAGLFDEAVHLAQPEAGALARLFGREERLEGALDHLLGHAGAGVGDRDLHVLAGLHVDILPTIAFVEIGVAGLDGQFAAFRHGVAGIDRKVENGAFQLGGIGLDRPDAAATDDLQRHVLAKRTPQEVRQAVEHAIDVEHRRVERLLTREGEQPLGQGRRALRAVHGVFQTP